MTYVRIKGGWCCLAVVLDLYARLIVGFSVSDSPDSVLTTDHHIAILERRHEDDMACGEIKTRHLAYLSAQDRF